MRPHRIREYLARAPERQQCLGRYDCVRFTIELLHVGFGRDYRADLGYCDRRSAVARLRAAGGLRAAFSEKLGPEVDGSLLEPGDIAFYDKPATVGLVLPSCVAVFSGNQLHALDRSTAQSGWKTD